MKIAIIGYSGSGKSTLAETLAKHYDVPLLYLDKVQWLPDWKEQTRENKDRIIKDFLDTHTDWVIDGTYSRFSFERRMDEADQIIFMNFNRLSCLYRAVKRYHQYKGRTRASITEGCNEKIDIDFIYWILYQGRTPKVKERFTDVVKKYPDKTVIISNQKQLDRFYNTIKTEHKL